MRDLSLPCVGIRPVRLRLRARNGFTLVELMVVVVIMAILSGALAPSLVSAVRRTGARTAAAKAADLLDFAYAAAITRREPVMVNFDVERRSCWVSVRGSSLPWLPEAEERGPRTLVSIAVPHDIEVSFHRAGQAPHGLRSSRRWETIRFGPDGTAEDMVIEFADPGGNRWRVEVIAASGEVLLEEER